MRPKALQCVITFQSTTQAMAFEKVVKANGLTGRLIPLPRAIGAGCGLAWREMIHHKETVIQIILQNNLSYEALYEIVI